jgi:hypothetical protein
MGWKAKKLKKEGKTSEQTKKTKTNKHRNKSFKDINKERVY